MGDVQNGETQKNMKDTFFLEWQQFLDKKLVRLLPLHRLGLVRVTLKKRILCP